MAIVVAHWVPGAGAPGAGPGGGAGPAPAAPAGGRSERTVAFAVVDVADGNGGDYIQEMLENPEIAMQFNVIDGHLRGNLERCNEFRKRYSKYRYLWTTDLSELFREFLETAWVAEGAPTAA